VVIKVINIHHISESVIPLFLMPIPPLFRRVKAFTPPIPHPLPITETKVGITFEAIWKIRNPRRRHLNPATGLSVQNSPKIHHKHGAKIQRTEHHVKHQVVEQRIDPTVKSRGVVLRATKGPFTATFNQHCEE